MLYKFVKVNETQMPPKLSSFFEEVEVNTYDLSSDTDIKRLFEAIKVKGEEAGIVVKDSDANALIDILANLSGDEISEDTLNDQFSKYFEL